MSDMIARGMAANAMSSGGGGGGGTTVDAYSKNETDNLLRGKANASDVYTSQQTDDLLDDKVDKVSGKGLSTNDYTNEDMSLVKTISNKANTNDVNASITNLQNQISETSENVDTINTELMTNAGYSLGMSINPTTFELTMTLKNSTGGTVSSQKVDLPIESMVVSASYANGKLSLKLQNGQTLDTDISAIVAGLVNQNFTIAGINMKDNIEANELKTALGINTITSDVSTLKNDMSTAKTNILTIQSDISGLKTRDSELQSDIDENTTAIEQNKSDISSAKNDLDNLPLHKALVTNANVDLNTELTVGSYVYSGCTFQNLPFELSNAGMPPHYVVVEKLLDGSTIWLRQTIGRYDLPYEYFRIYHNKHDTWKRTDGVIISTGNDTDRTTEINNLLSRYKHVKLGVGEFYVGKITVPTGCTLEGCGEKTVLVKIATDANVPTVMANSKSTVKDLSIKGTLTEEPTSEATYDKDMTGIMVEGVVEPVIIQNCRITGFTHSGIHINNTGASCKSVLISDCEITNSNIGLNIISSEFMSVNNVVLRDNYIGCNNAGGNNKFTGCGFDSNGYGLILADDANDGHGSCVACTFDHNTVKSISANKINFGFIFSACQIHYGYIYIDDVSKGIQFNGCNFGQNVVIQQYAQWQALFINSCTFYQDVRSKEDYVANKIIYNDCYLYNGTQITNS